MSGVAIHIGDCREVLRGLPSGSVHCVVTSPPYWGLRDYGADGQIGLEQTPDEYVAEMVAVFREVRRVLRDDGTLWLNLGDCYATGGGKVGECPGGEQGERWRGGHEGKHGYAVTMGPMTQPNRMPLPGLKAKDLVGIPWMVAFALRADGWWLRGENIWHKPNPMPSSVQDRCTPAHEQVFQFAKAERYFFDMEAVREPAATGKWPGIGPQHSAARDRGEVYEDMDAGETRQPRSVWTIPTRPYAEAHFATFPIEIPDKCIRAGTSEKGCCDVCGAPQVRDVERKRRATRSGDDSKTAGETRETFGNRDPQRHVTDTKTVGWRRTCGCDAGTVPCVVMDPFNGAGTTGLAARLLGRQYVGIELNPAYADMAQRRIARGERPSTFADQSVIDDSPLFTGAAL